MFKFGAAKGTASKFDSKDTAAPVSRHSNGLDQFCSMLRVAEGLSVLDLSGASQANISFITGLGHRISSDDVVATMQQCFGPGDFIENQQPASTAQRFLDQALTFPDESFDGILAWDVLQFFAPPLLDRMVETLLRVLKPGGLMLLFFSADEKASHLPVYGYRIQDQKTLLLTQRSGKQRIQHFNNRALEKLFHNATYLKFFLTRDHLRELIVRK